MKIFGLRLSRIPEFLECVRLSMSRPGAYLKLVKGAWGVLTNRHRMPPPPHVHYRLRTCLRCPHHIGGYHNFRSPLRCRKCGCYIPYLVSSQEVFSPCPANEEDETKGWI